MSETLETSTSKQFPVEGDQHKRYLMDHTFYVELCDALGVEKNDYKTIEQLQVVLISKIEETKTEKKKLDNDFLLLLESTSADIKNCRERLEESDKKLKDNLVAKEEPPKKRTALTKEKEEEDIEDGELNIDLSVEDLVWITEEKEKLALEIESFYAQQQQQLELKKEIDEKVINLTIENDNLKKLLDEQENQFNFLSVEHQQNLQFRNEAERKVDNLTNEITSLKEFSRTEQEKNSKEAKDAKTHVENFQRDVSLMEANFGRQRLRILELEEELEKSSISSYIEDVKGISLEME